jgi:hypothetical protein
MRTLALGFALALATAPASASVLNCSFTEPFFSIGFDPKTGTVTRTSPDDADVDTGEIKAKVIAEGAKLTRDDVWQDHPTATLRAATGEILMVVRFKEGSDGMSDFVFPLEGQWGEASNGNNVGGCETEKVQAYDAYELYMELGLEP